MSTKTGRATDDLSVYLRSHSDKLHPVQEALIKRTMEHAQHTMLGSCDELQLLANIVRYMPAKKTLDIGVFTGYSALTIALALPEDGKVVACDVSDEFTSIGKPFWKEAGVDNKIDLRIAPAIQTLNDLINNGESGTFDFSFIDANKSDYNEYYELSLQLLRPGGLIAVDNALWANHVLNPEPGDVDTQAIAALNDKIADDPRVHRVLLAIGDGTFLAWKKF